LAFKLDDKDKYPNYKDVKILVQPQVPFAVWTVYADGLLNSEGKIRFYSAQEIIDGIMEKIS